MIREFAASMPQDSVVRLSALYLPLLVTLIVGIYIFLNLFLAILLANLDQVGSQYSVEGEENKVWTVWMKCGSVV